MVSLISVWKLKHEVPAELEKTLKNLADEVKINEPDTLVYTVHLPVADPLATTNSSPEKPQPEVVFFEVYKDLEAFKHHLNGDVFKNFLCNNLKYFVENPKQPGHPLATTTFLQRESAFFRC